MRSQIKIHFFLRKAKIVASLKPVCLIVPAAMIAAGIINPVGGIIFTTRELAVAFGLLYLKNSYELKGYNLWMSVYLILKGVHWVNYPLPPPETWNPF